MFGAVVAASLPSVGTRVVAAQASGPDDWIKEVKGTHRNLFDFPQHKYVLPSAAHPQLHQHVHQGYKAAAGTVGAVGTFYGIGNQSSIALGFNDAMWAKYGLGEYLGLKDASGKFYTRNVFNKATKDDAHLVFQALQTPAIPAFADFMPLMSIESLQKMGTKFILCNNALEAGVWSWRPAARGRWPTFSRT